MRWRSLLVVFGICAALGVTYDLAEARSPYDGTWSVLIITNSGPCDRAYRYSLAIRNGVVSYAGEGSFTVRGRVAGNGSVSVRVSRGSQYAQGSGRLTSRSGNGTWSGKSSTGSCSGRWQAERR